MKSRSTVKQTLALFWQFTKPYKPYFWIGTLGAAVSTIIADIIPPVIIAAAFDKLQTQVNSGASLEIEAFFPYIWGYMAFMIVGIFSWRTQVWFVWQYEVRAIRNMAVHVFDHLQHMGATFHANNFGGALVSQTNKLLSAYEKSDG